MGATGMNKIGNESEQEPHSSRAAPRIHQPGSAREDSNRHADWVLVHLHEINNQGT